MPSTAARRAAAFLLTATASLGSQIKGPASIEAAAAANNLGAQLHCVGKYGAAMKLYLRALEVYKLPANAPATQLQVVDVLCNLALVARACGELQEAIGYIKASLSPSPLLSSFEAYKYVDTQRGDSNSSHL